MPTTAAYTTDYTLTNYAVSYYASTMEDAARFIAPSVPTGGLKPTYKLYDRGEAFVVDDTRTGLYMRSKRVNIHAKDETVMLERHSLEIPISDRELIDADKAFTAQYRRNKTNFLLKRFNNAHQKLVFDEINALVQPTTGNDDYSTGIGQWSTAANEPLKHLKSLIRHFGLANGVYPTSLLLSPGSWDILAANASVQDKLEFYKCKELDEESLCLMLGMSKRPFTVMAPLMPYNATGDGSESDNVDLMGNNVYLFYKEETPSLEDISAVKTLNIAGAEEITAIESYREDAIESEWLRIKTDKRVVVAAPGSIVRISVS